MLLFAPISYCMLIVGRSAQHWLWMRLTEVVPALVERVAVSASATTSWKRPTAFAEPNSVPRKW